MKNIYSLRHNTARIIIVVLVALLATIITSSAKKGNYANKEFKNIKKPDFTAEQILKPRTQPSIPEEFEESPFIDDAPEPNALPDEEQRGYILFNRPITQPVYRSTNPRNWERTTKLSAFATPGEYEPLSFSLYPLRNMKNLRVKVSPLKCGRSVIKETNLDLRAVTYWNIRYPRYTSKNIYRSLPELLEKVNSIDLTKYICQRFWLKVHVPIETKPGLYKGHITVYESGADQALQLPISFQVLDYTLTRDPNKRYSVYYDGRSYLFGGIEGEALLKARETELKSMLSYGIDMFPTVSLGEGRDTNGIPSVYIRNDVLVNQMIKLGFKGPIPIGGGIPHFYKHFVPGEKIKSHWRITKFPTNNAIYETIEDAFRNLKKESDAKGWPELICCPIDEASPISAEFVAQVYAAVRRSGIKTYITKDPTSLDAHIYRKYDAINAWCSQPYAESYEKVISDEQCEYWSYPNHNAGELKDRVIMQKGGRMTYGFGLWRSGYTTLIPWKWRWVPYLEDQFDYLRGRASGCGARMDENQEVLPAIYWEAFREGYDDLRYLYTLQQAIIQRKEITDKKCQKLITDAKTLIQEIWDSIEPQTKYLNSNMWADDTFNARRLQIAIMTQKLLKFSATNKDIAPSVLATPHKKVTVKDDGAFITASLQQGLIDQLSLSENDYQNWRAINKEVTMRTIPVEGKAPSLQFDVKVDHNVDGGGENGKYPMGWPRIRHGFKKGQVDLSKYDYLYFKVKVDSDRSEVADDTTPFIINFSSYSPGTKYDVRIDLGDKQRTWIPVVLSLREMIMSSGSSYENWKQLAAIQLVIAESFYKHDTQLEFEIRDLALLKFNSPIIQDIVCSEIVISPQQNYLIDVKGFGFESGIKQKATITTILTNLSGKRVIKQQLPLSEKPQFILNLESLTHGPYQLIISVVDVEQKVLSSKTKTIEIIKGF